MKRLNYKNFKKVHEDADSATLQHPEGHEIKIAKGPLSDHIKKQLGALPFAHGGEVQHFKDGGKVVRAPNDDTRQYINGKDVGPAVEATHRPDAWGNLDKNYPNRQHIESYAIEEKEKPKPEGSHISEDVAAGFKRAFGYASGGSVLDEEQSPEQYVEQNLMRPETAMPQAPVVNQDFQDALSPEQGGAPRISPFEQAAMPSGLSTSGNQAAPPAAMAAPMPATPNYPAQALEMGTAGALGAAGAEHAKAQSDVAAIQKDRNDQAAINAYHQPILQETAAEMQQVYQELKNNKIDPNHFWNERSTVGKVSTAIGLILGGMGAGLTGGENPALKFLNQQIDRDVEGQKAQQGQRMNMLTALQHQYGNQKDAMNMAKAMQANVIASKLMEDAAKSNDAMAIPRAQTAVSALLATYGPPAAQTMQRQAVLQAMQGGAIDPGTAVNALVPEHDRHKAYEELQKAQIADKATTNINKTLDEAFAISRPGNRMLNPIQSGKQLESMETTILANLKPIFGVLSESDKKQALANMPGSLTNDASLARFKQTMSDLIKANTVTPLLDSYGIKMKQPAGSLTNKRK